MMVIEWQTRENKPIVTCFFSLYFISIIAWPTTNWIIFVYIFYRLPVKQGVIKKNEFDRFSYKTIVIWPYFIGRLVNIPSVQKQTLIHYKNIPSHSLFSARKGRMNYYIQTFLLGIMKVLIQTHGYLTLVAKHRKTNQARMCMNSTCKRR